ncbi:unnamed protein product [Protopolystoma xenopodis]|uniref:Uncharacterized protein n=1 Tax=Protopolystoma xenopodis TaxID=117903 RepID=A0A3S5AYP6_9PLAT|nr:unnamed protein product [Protopolystoma xenopodis]
MLVGAQLYVRSVTKEHLDAGHSPGMGISEIGFRQEPSAFCGKSFCAQNGSDTGNGPVEAVQEEHQPLSGSCTSDSESWLHTLTLEATMDSSAEAIHNFKRELNKLCMKEFV